jgi:RNA recognition motif-containing protein
MRLIAPARAMQRTMVQQNQVRNFMNLNRVQFKSVYGTQMMRNFSAEANPPSPGLYIENIATDADENAIREIFEKYGTVVSVNILMSGKGFVNYDNLDNAVAAFTELDGKFEIDGESIPFGYVRPKNHKDSKFGRQLRTVYVGNIAFGTEAWQIEDFFSSCGKIEDIRQPMTENGQQRGFAFIRFDEKEAIEAALDLTGMELEGRSIRVSQLENNNNRRNDNRRDNDDY